MTKFKPITAAALLFASATFAGMAHAASIEGNWKTASGENAVISKCGGSFCLKLVSGKYSGKTIGRVKASGKKYTGTVTDPSEDKTYSGSASVSGSSMKLTGCALKIFCKTQVWKRR